MEQSKNKTNGATYTQDQVRDIVAEIFAKIAVDLDEPSLIIAGALAMIILDEKLK